jgi:DNA-binding NarL/FixJ family response regulator
MSLGDAQPHAADDLGAEPIMPIPTGGILAKPSQRVAVTSAVRLFRDGLVQLLKEVSSIEVVASGPIRADALVQLAGLHLDVVLVQVFSREDSLLVRSLLQLVPQARLIAVGVPDVDEVIVVCAEAGVSGYVRAEASADDLVSAIYALANNQSPIPPQTAAALLRQVAARGADSHELASSLTSRELEIVYCIREGLSNKQIAGRLGIDPSTVKNHIHSVLQKLHVRRRAQAAAMLRLF